jgi:hypothetical protein
MGVTRDIYDGQPARVATIECAPDERHTIGWDRGHLTLHDHDLEAELTLHAMGADLPICLELERAYTTSIGNPEMLTVACTSPESRSDLIAMRDAERRHPISPWVFAGATPAGVTLAVRKAFEAHSYAWMRKLIANLPDPLKAAYVVDSAVSIAAALDGGQQPHDFDYDELLRSQVSQKLIASLRSWVARADHDPTVHIDARLARGGAGSHVTSWPASVDITVPVRWFADVWARGIRGCVEDCFILDVDEVHTADELHVRAIRWRRGDAGAEPVVGPARIQRLEQGWTLMWDPT